MGVGCARAGGRWEHRKSSVDVLLANPGGLSYACMEVLRRGTAIPLAVSCRGSRWGTNSRRASTPRRPPQCGGAWGGGGWWTWDMIRETRLGATCVCAGRLHLCRPVCLQHVRRAFRRPLRPSTPFAHHRSTAWRWHLSPRSRQFSGYRSTFRTLQARVVGQILLHHVRCTFLRPLRPFHPVRSSPNTDWRW